jgi:hypothetical protein
MLLATTTHITQNVASVPFLWVLPLVLYLTTFILCFDSQGWYRPRWMAPLAAALAAVMLGALSWRCSAGRRALAGGRARHHCR